MKSDETSIMQKHKTSGIDYCQRYIGIMALCFVSLLQAIAISDLVLDREH